MDEASFSELARLSTVGPYRAGFISVKLVQYRMLWVPVEIGGIRYGITLCSIDFFVVVILYLFAVVLFWFVSFAGEFRGGLSI